MNLDINPILDQWSCIVYQLSAEPNMDLCPHHLQATTGFMIDHEVIVNDNIFKGKDPFAPLKFHYFYCRDVGSFTVAALPYFKKKITSLINSLIGYRVDALGVLITN